MAKTKDGQNRKQYRELSEPKESADRLNDAVNGFFTEVERLRVEYKLRDVYVTVKSAYLGTDGEEVDGFSRLGLGDEFQAESMLAYAQGQVQAERQQYIGSLTKHAFKATR